MRRLLTSIDLSQHIEEFRQTVNRIPNPTRQQPSMTIRRRSSYGGNFGARHQWALYCNDCYFPGVEQPIMIGQMSTWDLVTRLADYHAHNHH